MRFYAPGWPATEADCDRPCVVDACMYTIRITTWINAPIARCFDLARSVDAHLESASHTGERVIVGPTTGLLGLGDEITWEAKHFGITQRLSAKITAFEPPAFFQDRMIQGAFKFLEHDHLFEAQDRGTLMTDLLRFQAPLGPLGWVAERILVGPHMRKFLVQRAAVLKKLAEESVDRP